MVTNLTIDAHKKRLADAKVALSHNAGHRANGALQTALRDAGAALDAGDIASALDAAGRMRAIVDVPTRTPSPTPAGLRTNDPREAVRELFEKLGGVTRSGAPL